MRCGPDHKANRRLNAIHLLLIGVSFEHVPPEEGKQLHLVLDNAGWHKSAGLHWHHIRPFYLSPYSPDFNPIERLWQHLKGNAMAGYLTKNGEALGTKPLESLQAVLNDTELVCSVCSPPGLNRQ